MQKRMFNLTNFLECICFFPALQHLVNVTTYSFRDKSDFDLENVRTYVRLNKKYARIHYSATLDFEELDMQFLSLDICAQYICVII